MTDIYYQKKSHGLIKSKWDEPKKVKTILLRDESDALAPHAYMDLELEDGTQVRVMLE